MKRTLFLLAALFFLLFGAQAEQVWEEFPILPGESVWASSILRENLSSGWVSYPPENLFDKKPSTAWVEGVDGYGEGEYVRFILDRPVVSVTLTNGFARSERLYRLNSRPQRIDLDLMIGFTAPGLISETDAELYFLTELGKSQRIWVDDTLDPQSFSLALSPEEQTTLQDEACAAFFKEYSFFADEICADLGFDPYSSLTEEERQEVRALTLTAYAHTFMGLTIDEVYPGDRYRDTCISECELLFE